MDVKKIYRRFLAWQRNPVSYVNKSQGTVRCANCGTEFADNFCPRCGQRAGIGRVNWEAVRQNVMLLWGFDSRSFINSLIQLLLRPGYLISDYISGRRQMSYPPVSMLFLVALICGVVEYITGKLMPETKEAVSSNSELWDTIHAWTDDNMGWAVLIVCCFLIVPTWVLFKYSPRNSHHTLPAGFFIQVFMGSLFLLLDTLKLRSSFMPLYLVIAYRQLFGFSWWTTIWRLTICLIVGFVFILDIMFTTDIYFDGLLVKDATLFQILRFDFITISGVTLILAVIALIDGQRACRARKTALTK